MPRDFAAEQQYQFQPSVERNGPTMKFPMTNDDDIASFLTRKLGEVANVSSADKFVIEHAGWLKVKNCIRQWWPHNNLQSEKVDNNLYTSVSKVLELLKERGKI